MKPNYAKQGLRQQIFACLLLLVMICSVLQPSPLIEADEDDTSLPIENEKFQLSFDLSIEQFEDVQDLFEASVTPEDAILGLSEGNDESSVNLEEPDNQNAPEESFNDFSIEFALHVPGQEDALIRTMTYSPSTGTWLGNVSFENIDAKYEQVEVVYDEDLGEVHKEANQLQYDLFLIESEADNKVILHVPSLGIVTDSEDPSVKLPILEVRADTREKNNIDQYDSETIKVGSLVNQGNNTDTSSETIKNTNGIQIQGQATQFIQLNSFRGFDDSADGYKFNFTLKREEFGRYESIWATYYNYWSWWPDWGIADSSALKSFKINHTLNVEGQAPITQAMSYDADSWSWDLTISFDNISVAYDKIEIQYYKDEHGNFYAPYLLNYDLYLERSDEDQKMILKIPLLYPTNIDNPTGEEKILKLLGETIYLNGQEGNDEYFGNSPEEAVKTFDRAKELALNNPCIDKIIVTGTTDIDGIISLDGTNIDTIYRGNFNGYLFKVKSGDQATLSNIILDGDSDINEEIEKSLIYVDSGATLNITKGTVLRNNKIKVVINGGPVRHGGAIYANNATVNMMGGIIEDNHATYGGGIYLKKSIMDFSCGIIRNNWSMVVIDKVEVKGEIRSQYYSAGGGILVDDGSVLNMYEGGQVLDNFSQEIGGGISVGSDQPGPTNILNMYGGLISINESKSSGSGIFIQAGPSSEKASKAYIYGGRISDNKMIGKGLSNHHFGGGGIYVNGYRNGANGELYLQNAIITNNTSEGPGGGYAACPTTHTKTYVTNGVALYSNSSSPATVFGRHVSQGEDIFIYCTNNADHLPNQTGHPEYILAPKMLGGINNNWIICDDDSLLNAKKYTGKLVSDHEYIALHTDEKGNALTKLLGKVIISGNTSTTMGAGIGSNGTVIFGEEGTTEVSVTKKWNDNDNADGMRPDSIIINLLVEVDGQNYVMDSAVLSEASNWAYTFRDLPTKNGAESFVYHVEEVAVSGYTGEISGDQETGFIITNIPVPEESKPTKPTESKPSTPPPPSVTVSSPIVFKKITGGQPETADLFTFRIEPVSYKPDQVYPMAEPNSLPLPQGEQGAVQEVQISGEGTTSTGQITYKQPGYYEYKIQEIAAADGKYIYSTDVYSFVDHVYMRDGQLVVDRTMYKNGQIANTTTAYFTNQYQGEPKPPEKFTSLPATGEKDLLGGSLSLTLAGLGCLALIKKKHIV